MRKLIRSSFEHSTVIAIAHHLETILDFERVAVVEKGRVIEFDTPSALLSRDSAFKRLYEAQDGGI